jgi:hypothetical protein
MFPRREPADRLPNYRSRTKQAVELHVESRGDLILYQTGIDGVAADAEKPDARSNWDMDESARRGSGEDGKLCTPEVGVPIFRADTDRVSYRVGKAGAERDSIGKARKSDCREACIDFHPYHALHHTTQDTK